MWNPDIEPVFSFERYARKHGLSAARDHWAWLEFEHKRQQMEAHAIELALAKDAERKPNIVNEEIGGAAAWEMAAYSYWELHQSTVHERGCVGGELMNDTDYMRFFLKRNPECRRTCTSGNIMGGWTPQLEAAAAQAKAEREAQAKLRGGLIA